MAVIENLDIVLGARTDKLDAGLDRSTGRVKKFEADVGGIGKAAEATLAPLRDLGLSILAAVPGASAAATAFAAIAAAFSGSAASKVAKETRETALESTKAAAAMSGFASASAVAATAAGRAATAAAFASAAGSQVSREARETAVWAAGAATAMTEYATAAVVAAAATGRIGLPDMPRIGSRARGNGGGLAVYNPATARAGARGDGMGDVIDAEFTQITAGATTVGRSMSLLGPVGIAVGATVAAAFVAVGVAAAGAVVTIRGVREQLGEIDRTADAAKRLGFQFNELVTLRLSLGRSTGMDDSQIDSALSKMQLNLAAARSGSGALADQLKSLGLDAGQLLQAGPVEAMKQITAAAAEMKAPIDQNKLAFDLAGKAGVGLAQALRDGPSAINEAAGKAKQLGLTLSQAQTEQVGAANDAWEDMQLIATGVFRQIAAEVAPVITAISTSISEVAMGFGGWQAALPAVIDNVTLFAGALYDAWELSDIVRSTLYKIVTLDWGSVSDGIKSAFDFSTGDQWVAKINEARKAAAETAAKPAPPAPDGDAIEAENELAKASKARADQDKESIATRLAGLREEVSMLRLNRTEAERLQLKNKGATEPQLKEFDRLTATKALNDEMERGRQIAAEYRTPMEEFDTQLQDLNKLFNVGAIDFNTYARATREAAKKAGDAGNDERPAPKIAMMQKGSVEAFQQGKATTDAAKGNQRSEKLLEQVNLNLKNIEAKLGAKAMMGV